MRSFIDSYGQIPENQLQVYLSQGYLQDDYVGTSYLKLELEPILRSVDDTTKFIFNTEGDVVSQEVIKEGHRGNDVYLTIDLNIQKIVEENITQTLQNNNYELNKNVFLRLLIRIMVIL